MGDAMFMLFPILTIVFSLVPIALAIYVVIMWVNLTKERNAYLKQIAEELRKR